MGNHLWAILLPVICSEDFFHDFNAPAKGGSLSILLLRVAILKLQLKKLQSRSKGIFLSSHCWKELLLFLPFPNTSVQRSHKRFHVLHCWNTSCKVVCVKLKLSHHNQWHWCIKVQPFCLGLAAYTKGLQHSETYLNNAQSSWRYRIWEVTSWWRDTEQKDIEGKVNQNHWHTLIWAYDHTGPWYTNKKGQHHISNGLQILTVVRVAAYLLRCVISITVVSVTDWQYQGQFKVSQGKFQSI